MTNEMENKTNFKKEHQKQNFWISEASNTPKKYKHKDIIV